MSEQIKLLQSKVGVVADGNVGPATLKAVRNYFKLTNEQTAHFIGQLAHETGGFAVFSENLNYSAAGLLSTFGKYFNSSTAASYQRKPMAIANRVYANRMGNGSEQSGDGWKFRGRGAVMCTGRDNYLKFANYIGKPEVVNDPDTVASKYAFDVAIWFFKVNGLFALCTAVNDASILAVTKRINGGTNGLVDRKNYTIKYYNMLK